MQMVPNYIEYQAQSFASLTCTLMVRPLFSSGQKRFEKTGFEEIGAKGST